MTKANSILPVESGEGSTLKESILNYLRSWPLFLLLILLCVTAGYIYTLYTPGKYYASTTFLIKGSEESTNSGDLLQTALNGKPQVNLNSEILMASSTELMDQTVRQNRLNVLYFRKDKFINTNIYKESPFILFSKALTDSNQTYTIKIKNLTPSGGTLVTGKTPQQHESLFRWDSTFVVDNQYFILRPRFAIADDKNQYIVIWQPIEQTASELSDGLNVKAYDKETNAIQMEIKTGNAQYGVDVLNGLFNQFNRNDISERDSISQSTVKFIDERLVTISEELAKVEGHVENFQKSNQLIDIKGQSAMSLENASNVVKAIKDLAIQQNITAMIREYFSSPSGGGRLVPSALGLNDGTLASLITQYNELQLKKEREAPLVAPNSTVMQDLTGQLSNLKSSILESLNNIGNNLKLQEQNLQQQNQSNQNYISSIPHSERVLQGIGRQKNVTEGLYLYLLQKREETAISSKASTTTHYRQIDSAVGYGPIEPNPRNIILYSIMLAIFLSFAFIYILQLFKNKITRKEDVTSKVEASIIGEINHHSRRKKQAIPVLERSLVSEQFRTLRTNLSFILRTEQAKTILITSSVSGDGKSFISLNLAAVCAIPGKKVALLEFDIRNPVINDHLFIDNTTGLTNFISGELDDISKIYRIVEEIPTLHIFPCGPIPNNPADLLLSDRISVLLERLKTQYDYIIIDAAPAGLVTDPMILAKYADLVLYIVRQDSTLKKHLNLLNEIISRQTLSNLYLVLNDVKSSVKSSYKKYYGYGKGRNN